MKHTPGPWLVETVKTSIGHAHKIGPINTCIYVDHRAPTETDSKTAANARLIAAAPDMLETLLEVEEYLNDRADVDDGIPDAAMRLLVEVKAAIAKATVSD